jgi:VWFA-related protein
MRIFPAVVVALLALCAAAASQTPIPAPTPPPDDADVVKITTALIQVDVTVTDRKGNAVRDLRPEEIEIYENGEKQKITNFSFVSNLRAATEDSTRTEVGKPNPIPPPRVRAESVRRTMALVVDDLSLSFESVYYVRRALKKFVDEQMQEGDLVAIIRTGAGIGALQQFTNDRRQLYAAIERVRWNPLGTGNIGAFARLDARLPTGESGRPAGSGERTPEGVQREFDDFRESLFATGTLGAVDYVVRGMRELPGRKSILLLSDGFSLFTQDASGFKETGRVMQGVKALIEMANRASVVIYTMDARGLQVTGLTAADNTDGWTRSQINSAVAGRRDRLFDTQSGLHFLAKETGGLSIVNSNDRSGGIRKILDDQSYYLVGYEPDDATFDPKTRRFNNLEIKVTRPETRVRYRSGFFGIADEEMARPPETPTGRLMNALTSPFGVNQVSLHLNTLFYNTVRNGNIIRSLVHINAKDLKFIDEPDGGKKVVFDLIAVGFGDNGTVVDQVSNTFTLVITKDKFEKVLRTGMVYDFSFPIKNAGAYQLRVALRDHGSDRLGSANQFVEVPNVKKGNLVLSGVLLENIPFDEWQKRNLGQDVSNTDPSNDTSLRQFKRGTVLNYAFTIYNAQGAATSPNLSYQTRVFRDGEAIFEGAVQPVVASQSDSPKNIGFSGSLALGTGMEPGDYVLQVVIKDNLARSKRNTASTFVQFEITE